MSSTKMFFPVYRKLSNHKRFYEIISNECFVELQLVGKKIFKIKVFAEKYPEKLLVQDMINQIEPYLNSSSVEFNFYLDQVEK